MSQEFHVQTSTPAPLVKDTAQPQFIYVYPSDTAPVASSGAGSTTRRTANSRPSQDWLKVAVKRESLAAISTLAVVLLGWGWLNRTIAQARHESYTNGYNTALMDAQQQINKARAAQALAEAKTAQAQSTVAQIQAIVSQPAPGDVPAPAIAPVPSPMPSPAPMPVPVQ